MSTPRACVTGRVQRTTRTSHHEGTDALWVSAPALPMHSSEASVAPESILSLSQSVVSRARARARAGNQCTINQCKLIRRDGTRYSSMASRPSLSRVFHKQRRQQRVVLERDRRAQILPRAQSPTRGARQPPSTPPAAIATRKRTLEPTYAAPTAGESFSCTILKRERPANTAGVIVSALRARRAAACTAAARAARRTAAPAAARTRPPGTRPSAAASSSTPSPRPRWTRARRGAARGSAPCAPAAARPCRRAAGRRRRPPQQLAHTRAREPATSAPRPSTIYIYIYTRTRRQLACHARNARLVELLEEHVQKL